MKDHWEEFYGNEEPDSEFQRDSFNKWFEQGIQLVEKMWWDIISKTDKEG